MRNELPLPYRQALPWVIFITLLFLMNYMSRSLLSPLLVSIERDLGVGHADATSLLLMQSIGQSVALGITGFTFSKIRPRTMAVYPLVASGIVLMAMPLVASLGNARLLFLLFGFCAGFYFPSGMAVLATLVFPKDWGKAVSIHELAPNGGFILIPLLAQLGLMFMDWRSVFLCMGIIMITTGLSFAVWGRGGTEYTAPPSFKGCGELLRNPASWAAILILTVSMIGEFSIFSILQLYLVSEVQFEPETANIVLSLSRIASPVVVILGGFAADRYHAATVVRVCFFLHAVGLALMGFDPVAFRYIALCGVLMQALSIAFIFPSIFKVFAECFTPDQQPLLLSFSMPIAGLISAGGVPFFLGFCGEYLSFGAGFLCMALLSVATVFTVSFLRRA